MKGEENCSSDEHRDHLELLHTEHPRDNPFSATEWPTDRRQAGRRRLVAENPNRKKEGGLNWKLATKVPGSPGQGNQPKAIVDRSDEAIRFSPHFRAHSVQPIPCLGRVAYPPSSLDSSWPVTVSFISALTTRVNKAPNLESEGVVRSNSVALRKSRRQP